MLEQRAGAALASGSPFDALPTDPQFGNYGQAMQEVGTTPWLGFIDALSNSIVVTVLVVIGTILSSSLVGTAFARIRFRGRQPTFLLMLATMMLPAQVTMIPLFILFRSLGWVDTLLPLIVPAFFGSAFHILCTANSSHNCQKRCSKPPDSMGAAGWRRGGGSSCR